MNEIDPLLKTEAGESLGPELSGGTEKILQVAGEISDLKAAQAGIAKELENQGHMAPTIKIELPDANTTIQTDNAQKLKSSFLDASFWLKKFLKRLSEKSLTKKKPEQNAA